MSETDDAPGSTHVVQAGEDISSIAEQYGFHNYKTIWTDDRNEALREERQDPSALEAGDELYIPPIDPGRLPLSSDPGVENVSVVHSEHVDEADTTRVLALRFTDRDGQPIARKTGKLEWGTLEVDVTTDDDGNVSADVPLTPNSGTLTLQVFTEQAVTFTVYLPATDDQVDWGDASTIPGARARLLNLGYMFLPDGGDDAAAAPSAALAAQVDDVFARALDRLRGTPVDAASLPTDQVEAAIAARLAEEHGDQAPDAPADGDAPDGDAPAEANDSGS